MLSLFKRKCDMCSEKFSRKTFRHYLDDQGKKLYVCESCTLYAERRAFRKV